MGKKSNLFSRVWLFLSRSRQLKACKCSALKITKMNEEFPNIQIQDISKPMTYEVLRMHLRKLTA